MGAPESHADGHADLPIVQGTIIGRSGFWFRKRTLRRRLPERLGVCPRREPGEVVGRA